MNMILEYIALKKMKNKLIQLTLPEFAFVEGSWHEEGGDSLEGRTVILHVRSASVVEILPDYEYLGGEKDVVKYEFSHFNEQLLISENYIMLLHYSATLDKDLDRQSIIDSVMKPASKWYSDYCDWEDKQ